MAPTSTTQDPYECCGKLPEPRWNKKPGKRPRGLCHECKQLVADGQKYRLLVKEESADNLVLKQFFTANWEVRYMEGEYDSAIRDQLDESMYALCLSLSQPITGDRDYEAERKAGWLLPENSFTGRSHNHQAVFLFRKDRAALVAVLDREIRRSLADAYAHGLDEGRSLLTGLANGSVSVDDMNKASLTARASAKRLACPFCDRVFDGDRTDEYEQHLRYGHKEEIASGELVAKKKKAAQKRRDKKEVADGNY